MKYYKETDPQHYHGIEKDHPIIWKYNEKTGEMWIWTPEEPRWSRIVIPSYGTRLFNYLHGNSNKRYVEYTETKFKEITKKEAFIWML